MGEDEAAEPQQRAPAQEAEDTALAAFVLMLGFLQKPADPEQLRHAAGKGGASLDASDLLRLAKQLDVRAREVDAPLARLSRQPLPAIAQSKDGAFFLLLQVSDDKALVFHPHADKPQAVPLDVL
ncbi:MAG: cysteine peptidase family C39 domain-containing protein, partial [Terricaulis sp.]